MPNNEDTPQGFWFALSSYMLWGIFPLYFYWLRDVASMEVLVHRVFWSACLLMLMTAIIRPKVTWKDLIKSCPALIACLASTVFLTVNWLVYIWAVANGKALEGSLGYFINPLVSICLAALLLGERFNRYQLLAITFALLGVAFLVVRVGVFPWVAFALAFSFGLYGLIRKKYRVDAFAGLTLETLLVSPLAAAYLCYLVAADQLSLFHMNWKVDVLLLSAGIITTLPLLLFLASLPRLRLSSVGLIQYVAPTLQFLVAVFILKEPFDQERLIAFGLIWIGLLIFCFDILRQRRIRRTQLPPQPPGSA